MPLLPSSPPRGEACAPIGGNKMEAQEFIQALKDVVADLKAEQQQPKFMSPEINELAGALCEAQGEIGKALKSSSNPFFKSKYADLTACLDACREALHKHGLSICQIPMVEENAVGVTSLLLHKSGQWIRADLLFKTSKLSPQDCGSAVTYARRYTLASMVGLGQEDDDGEKAQQRGAKDEVKVPEPGKKKAPTPPPTRNGDEKINSDHVSTLKKAADENNWLVRDVQSYIKTLGYGKISEITVADFPGIVAQFSTPNPATSGEIS